MRVTAAGSLPGSDFRGAVRAMSEHLPEVLPWPELPGRGGASGMVGRALGAIEDLGFDVQRAGWRLAPASSAEHRRARAQWRADLDDAEELLQGFTGTLKVGVAGPWTLAATVERPRGDKLLADAGARREVAQALDEGVRGLRSELARRLPGATVWVQVDEPVLPMVASGAVPTASGLHRHPAVDLPELSALLAPLAPDSLLHCCAPGAWLDVAAAAAFTGTSIDSRLFTAPAELDALGEWLGEGHTLVLGVVDTTAAPQPADRLVDEALRVLRPLELDPDVVQRSVLLGTGCGLAGWSPSDVTDQLRALRRAADLLPERLAR